jgi:integrase
LTSELELSRDAVRPEDRVPCVFHRRGEPLLNFYAAWKAACREAGVPGRLFHDLRRTAVRNLERAGVPCSWPVRLTRHKTESVYRRYAIVAEQDLRDGAERLTAWQAEQTKRSAPWEHGENTES